MSRNGLTTSRRPPCAHPISGVDCPQAVATTGSGVDPRCAERQQVGAGCRAVRSLQTASDRPIQPLACGGQDHWAIPGGTGRSRRCPAPRPERRDTENDTMFGMGLVGLLLLAAILLIWTASLWKLGGWAGPRGGGSMVAALIVGSILGSFVGLLLVALSAARTTRRNRAVAIPACPRWRRPSGRSGPPRPVFVAGAEGFQATGHLLRSPARWSSIATRTHRRQRGSRRPGSHRPWIRQVRSRRAA